MTLAGKILLTEMGSPGGGTVLGRGSEFQLRPEDLKAKKQGAELELRREVVLRPLLMSTAHVYP